LSSEEKKRRHVKSKQNGFVINFLKSNRPFRLKVSLVKMWATSSSNRSYDYLK
jgi:hypothetical protein